jgi:hypothetical protein
MQKQQTKYILIFLFLLSGFHTLCQNNTLSQKVNISKQELTVDELIKEIHNQTGINFSYNNQTIDVNHKLIIAEKEYTVKQLLTKLSRETNIDYTLVEKQIILKKRKKKQSEEKHTVSGIIRDKETGESLIGATVLVDSSFTGTTTNSYGFFSLTLPEGNYILRISYIGYDLQNIKIKLDKNIVLNQNLQPDYNLLEEVIVESKPEEEMSGKSQMSRLRLNPVDIGKLPEFAGESGLVKSLQTLPGIETHSDGSAFFFVRGGNKDQNLILIDEAPVYNPAHLFGFYSVIIPEITKDIRIYKSDIPVDEGDPLSSLIKINTKDGNMNRFEANGVLSPFLYRASVEGPIVKDKSSFYTSFRHSNFKWIYKKYNPTLNLYFYDVNAKLNWQVNNNNRIYFSFYTGKDNLNNTADSKQNGVVWTNLTSTFRWNHIFNNRLFSNLTIYGSSYKYDLGERETHWVSEISNFSLKADFTYFTSPDLTFKFGFSQTFHKFNPGNLTYDTSAYYIPKVPRNRSSKSAFYANVEHKISKKISYRFGLRMPVWTNTGPTTVYSFDTNYQVRVTIVISGKESYITFVNLDPRISLKYRMSPGASLMLSYGIYHQYIQMLSNSIGPFSSFEVWMPAGANIKPQRADQVAIGFEKLFSKLNLKFSSEAYYKYMQHQIEYESHANLLLNPLIEGELRYGDAWSYGIEFFLKKTKGRLSGWLSYTYSRTFKQIKDVNNGKEFPAFYDRPHDFSVNLSYQLTERFKMSANWIYYTGSAITTPIAFYNYNGSSVPVYGDKHNDRLPDYHRLDFSMEFRLNKRRRHFMHSLGFALFNVYNRHNPVWYNTDKVETKNGKFVVPANLFGAREYTTTQFYLMGAVPSLTYKLRL